MNPAATNFTTTHWSVVLASAQGDSPQAAVALEQLCRTYWYPLYAFVRRQGHSPQDAEDLMQAFFARLLEKNYLNDVDRSKGRFRSFLLAALKHFLADEWDKATTDKRGGHVRFLSLEEGTAEGRYWEEPASDLTPEKLYEQRWACILLERVMQRLEQDSVEAGESHAVSYAELAVKLGVSEAALKMKTQRMRHRYQRLLREEITQTVASPAEVEDEIHFLFRVLGG
jgi:RNA polymerase sigma factor (sigma-70 family)